MSWSPDVNHGSGSETAKIRFDLIPYMRGRALDLGCGPTRAWPHFIGVDSGKDEGLFGVQMKPGIRDDVTKLSGLASGAYDTVFSSHTLEHIEDYQGALREWWRLLKVGGYLCLYLPHKDHYPRCDAASKKEWTAWEKENGAKYPTPDTAAIAFAETRRARGITTTGELYAGTHWTNPDHVNDFSPEDILAAMKKLGGGFDLVENQTRTDGDEYSFFQVYKKIPSGVRESWKSKPEKTVAIVRYGAIGDMMMVTSILPRLKEQGFHVTLYTGATGEELLKHNPHIDRLIVQEKDVVPPQMLNDFWLHEMKKYDRWVNLSESVEGRFLACPDRIEFWWPNKVRARLMDRNYLEHAHELAEVPGPYKTEFHATKEEIAWAKATAQKWGRTILWSLAGSTGHKAWPHLDAVIAAVMTQYRDVHIALVGDEACQILEQGWEREPRVHCLSGKWKIRESLAFAYYAADVVIGVETGLLNAVGCADVQKIITLSHSSQEMLTKHWKNVTVLEQPEGVGCPKRQKANGGACRQLHGGAGMDAWIDCPQEKETGTALCQHSVTAEMMWEAVQAALGQEVRAAA